MPSIVVVLTILWSLILTFQVNFSFCSSVYLFIFTWIWCISYSYNPTLNLKLNLTYSKTYCLRVPLKSICQPWLLIITLFHTRFLKFGPHFQNLAFAFLVSHPIYSSYVSYTRMFNTLTTVQSFYTTVPAALCMAHCPSPPWESSSSVKVLLCPRVFWINIYNNIYLNIYLLKFKYPCGIKYIRSAFYISA